MAKALKTGLRARPSRLAELDPLAPPPARRSGLDDELSPVVVAFGPGWPTALAAEAGRVLDERRAALRRPIVFAGGPPQAGQPHPHACVECAVGSGEKVLIASGTPSLSRREVVMTGPGARAAAARLDEELKAVKGLTRGPLDVSDTQVRVRLDLRHPADAKVAEAERELGRALKRLHREDAVKVETEGLLRQPRVDFDARVSRVIAHAADQLGLAHEAGLAEAFHAARDWASACKTGLFLAPALAGAEARADAVNILLGAVVALAEER